MTKKMENVYGKPVGRQNRGERVSQSNKNQVRAGIIMSRLARNAMGTLVDATTGEPVQLTASQIKSSEIFLSKTVPSLSATENTNIEEMQTPEQSMVMLKAMLEDPVTRRTLKQLLEDTEADQQLKLAK